MISHILTLIVDLTQTIKHTQAPKTIPNNDSFRPTLCEMIRLLNILLSTVSSTTQQTKDILTISRSRQWKEEDVRSKLCTAENGKLK